MPGFAKLPRRIVALLLFMVFAAAAFGIDVNSLPKPAGYVSDLANVVNPSDKEQLEALCTQIEQQLNVEFALVTIKTLDGRPIRDFALDLFRKWGVGERKTNQGILLLLAVDDHQSDIETGRGIEPYLTDGFSGSTLRAMRPDLRASNYGAALLSAARAMASQIAQGKGTSFTDSVALPPPEPQQEVPRATRIPWPLIIFGIFILLSLLGRGGRRGGGGGGGFLTGMLLGNLLGGSRGGGGWGSGGGFGGGDSGGGGFGGFGGGDAGGGGASSNW